MSLVGNGVFAHCEVDGAMVQSLLLPSDTQIAANMQILTALHRPIYRIAVHTALDGCGALHYKLTLVYQVEHRPSRLNQVLDCG